MGAWSFVQERMPAPIRYVGRAASASPSTGSLKRHQQEQAELIEEAFAAEIKSEPKRRTAGRRRR
jgi:2-oxoglutarate dehydrogenase E1 component